MRPIVSSVACSVLVCVVQKRMNRSLAGFEGHIRMGPRSRVLDGGGSGSHHEGALLRGGHLPARCNVHPDEWCALPALARGERNVT